MPSVSSLAEASAVLAAAHAEGRRLRIGEDLTAEGLDRILEHEAGDLTCTVEAGVRPGRSRRSGRARGPRCPWTVARCPGRGHASGRTTAMIGMEPAPAIVTLRPGRGAWTIAPSPMYMPTWLASSK